MFEQFLDERPSEFFPLRTNIAVHQFLDLQYSLWHQIGQNIIKMLPGPTWSHISQQLPNLMDGISRHRNQIFFELSSGGTPGIVAKLPVISTESQLVELSRQKPKETLAVLLYYICSLDDSILTGSSIPSIYAMLGDARISCLVSQFVVEKQARDDRDQQDKRTAELEQIVNAANVKMKEQILDHNRRTDQFNDLIGSAEKKLQSTLDAIISQKQLLKRRNYGQIKLSGIELPSGCGLAFFVFYFQY